MGFWGFGAGTKVVKGRVGDKSKDDHDIDRNVEANYGKSSKQLNHFCSITATTIWFPLDNVGGLRSSAVREKLGKQANDDNDRDAHAKADKGQ